MSDKQPKEGDLQVWHNPQVPGECYVIPVSSPEEGIKILSVLAIYDQFQLMQNIKPDYSNAAGLNTLIEIPMIASPHSSPKMVQPSPERINTRVKGV